MKIISLEPTNKNIKSYNLDIIIIAIGCIGAYFIAHYLDLFEQLKQFLEKYEFLNLDEVFFPCLVLLVGLTFFAIRRYIELKKEIVLSKIAKVKLQKEVKVRKKAEEYLHIQEFHTQHILSLVKRLDYTVSLNDILLEVKKVLKDVLDYDNVWFYKFSDDRKTADLVFSDNLPEELIKAKIYSFEISSDPFYKKVYGSKEIDIVENAQEDKITSQNLFVKGLKIHTLVHIPLLMGDEFIGLLGTGTLGKQGVNVPLQVEIEFMKSLSVYVAFALNRIMLQNERTVATFALKDSEEKYRALIDQSIDAIFLQEDGQYQIVNSKFIELLGVTQEDVHSDDFTLLNYTHPNSIELLKERKRKVKAGEIVSSRYEFTVLTKDKKSIEVEASISYIYAGGKLKTQGILRDISKRKRTDSIQSAIYQISEATNMSESLNDLVTAIHSILKTIMYAENFFVELYDSNTELYHSAYFVDQFDEVEYETAKLEGSLTDYIRRTGKAAIITDKKHASLVEVGEAGYLLTPSKVWMGAPLKTAANIFGVIALQSYENSDVYTSEDLELLSLISEQIAISIEKKRASDEIEKNREFFETVINTLENPLFVINVSDYSIAVANTAAKDLIFIKNTVERQCYKCGDENESACECSMPSCPITKLFETKKPVSFEQSIKGKNDVVSIYEVFAFPLFDEEGNVLQIIENLVDITERKRVENKLIELAVFPEANPNIVLSINRNNEVIYMNPSSSKMLKRVGTTKEEMHQLLPENLDEMIKLMISGDIDQQDIRTTINEYTFSWSFHPVKGQDIIHCYGHDVTQQVKQAYEINRLSMVATQSSNIIVITNLDGIVEYVNPYFTKVTGFDKEDIEGSNLSILKAESTSENLYKELWDKISNGNTWTGKIENKKKNEELYWESKTISPITNDAGDIISYISIGTDITNEMQMQRQLVESEKSTAIATLAAGVAHEFKNYLGGIIGNASFSLDEINSSDGLALAKDTLLKIIDMGEKANDVAMSLLTFSKAKSDDRKKEDLKKILTQSVSLIEKEFETLSIEIAMYFDEVPPVEVSLSKIQQLLLNLLINAKHAIGANGVITVALLKKPHSVEIRIGDTGNGIKKENLNKIFDPFFSTKGVWGEDNVHGTGMGLSICRNIAREHNGELLVESVIGVGTVFTISLPVTLVDNYPSCKLDTGPEQHVVFFTLDHSLVTLYHDEVCEHKLHLLMIDNFDKVDETILNMTEIVVCDAKFSAKLELYKMVEYCIQNNQPYVMVNCGTMEYQLSELYENSVANYKELPEFFKIKHDFNLYVNEKEATLRTS